MAKAKEKIEDMSVEALQGKLRVVNSMLWTIGGIMLFIVLTTVILYAVGFLTSSPLPIGGGVVAMSGALISMSATRKPLLDELKRRGHG